MVTTLKRWHSTYMCWRGSIRLNTLQKWLRHRFLFINFFWHLSNLHCSYIICGQMWQTDINFLWELHFFCLILMFSLQVNPIINPMSFHNSEEYLEHTWSLKRTYSTNHMHQINCCDSHTVSCSSCVLHSNTTSLVAQRKHLTLQV